MPKSRETKNSTLNTRSVTRELDRPLQLGRPIGVAGKFGGEWFEWMTGASWSSTLFWPVHDRRSEQLFLDAQKALCLIPAFRKEISRIRKSLPSRGLTRLDDLALALCKEWRIRGGESWITSLIANWDPDAEKYPPRSTVTPPDAFSPWTVEAFSVLEADGRPPVCRSATITLIAGISAREAQRVAAFAQRKLDPRNAKKGRPSLSDRERETLRTQFEKFGIPKRGQRIATHRKVQRACLQAGLGKFGLTLIGQEMRQWLREKKQPVRRYVTEPSPNTKKSS